MHHKNEFRKKRGRTVTTETVAVEEIQPVSIAVSLYPASLAQAVLPQGELCYYNHFTCGNHNIPIILYYRMEGY